MRSATIAIIMTLISALFSPLYAFDMKSLSDTATRAVDDGVVVTGDAQKLVDSLSSGLGVSAQQAAGGSAAMLAMAKNNLSSDQFQAITDKVPGISELMGGEAGGLAGAALSQVSNLKGISNAFSTLGLSPDMITQFAPTIIKFLGDQGVAGSVLNSLKGLWGAAG